MKVIGKAEVEDTSQLTEFTLTADSGSNQTIAHGDTMDIAGGDGIRTVVSATDTVTINHEDTSSQASVNNSGRTYIQDITLDTYGHVTGLTSATETVTNTDTNTTYGIAAEDGDEDAVKKIVLGGSDGSSDEIQIAASTGLSIARSSDKITLSCTVTDTNTQLSNAEVRTAVEAATDSNVFTDADHTKLNGIAASANNYSLPSANETTVGGVELATTAEADTGTDTSRAVTPAGLKSHVDARYSYQYLTFSFKAQSYISENWVTPSQNGPEYYFWNNTHGTGGNEAASHAPSSTSVGSSTITIDYLDQPSAFVIPKACKLDGFYGNARTNSTTPNTARPCMGLFRAAEPSDSNNADVTATCVALDKYDTSTGNRKNRFMKLETSGLNTDLAQGDLLFPAIGLDEAMSNSAGIIWGSFTIVLKTLIP